MIYNSVPELEYNGVRLAQSNAILRFLAKEYNLAGKDNVEAAVADAVVDACVDLFNGRSNIVKGIASLAIIIIPRIFSRMQIQVCSRRLY